MSERVAEAVPPQFAHLATTANLSGYDPEQSRLMGQNCILVDEHDKAWGAADKVACE
jgi:isopentenyl-diphosphate delta-isomerase